MEYPYKGAVGRVTYFIGNIRNGHFGRGQQAAGIFNAQVHKKCMETDSKALFKYGAYVRLAQIKEF
jgi:hypothetical protein